MLGSHKTVFVAHHCTLFVIYIELEFLSFYSLTLFSLPLAEVSLAFIVQGGCVVYFCGDFLIHLQP